jgi:hypothetical protein
MAATFSRCNIGPRLVGARRRDTQKFTYYQLPQLKWSVPKIEVEKNNTIWFGSRSVPHVVAVHFYPDGYSAAAPPEP